MTLNDYLGIFRVDIISFASQTEVTELPFGDIITDKDEVELALRRAQAAILNPTIESHKFLGMSAEQLKKGVQGSKQMLFSKNVVCVDLQGPDLTDLAFIDLPGMYCCAGRSLHDRLIKVSTYATQVLFKMPKTNS